MLFVIKTEQNKKQDFKKNTQSKMKGKITTKNPKTKGYVFPG